MAANLAFRVQYIWLLFNTLPSDCSISGEMESLHSSLMDASDICGENSSSNSNNSSISSVTSGSSDSDHKMDTNTSDLEADADSLICGRSINQMDANGSKQVSNTSSLQKCHCVNDELCE